MLKRALRTENLGTNDEAHRGQIFEADPCPHPPPMTIFPEADVDYKSFLSTGSLSWWFPRHRAKLSGNEESF